MMDGLFIFDLTFLVILPTMTFHPRFLNLPLHGLACKDATANVLEPAEDPQETPHSHSEVS